MAIKTVRIHPAIGIARLGDSPSDFFIGPERPLDRTPPPGGYKDANCKIKRQAARFRLVAYDESNALVKELTVAMATSHGPRTLSTARRPARNTGTRPCAIRPSWGRRATSLSSNPGRAASRAPPSVPCSIPAPSNCPAPRRKRCWGSCAPTRTGTSWCWAVRAPRDLPRLRRWARYSTVMTGTTIFRTVPSAPPSRSAPIRLSRRARG
jgi:hypothetical protein